MYVNVQMFELHKCENCSNLKGNIKKITGIIHFFGKTGMKKVFSVMSNVQFLYIVNLTLQ